MDFETLLGQLEATRPELSESLSLFRQFQNSKKESPGPAEVTYVDINKLEEMERKLEKQKIFSKNILAQFDQLKTNYKLLMDQMDEFAEAIGACPHCWGEDDACGYCRGRGTPGYFEPSQVYFDVYVKPIVLRLKSNRSQSINN